MGEFRFYPDTVIWEITFACNMRCLHCGTSAGKMRLDELNTEEALNLIDELASLDCELITLSGGEPLLRSDWKILAKRIKERGIKPYLITNGWAVDEKVIEDFKEVGFANIGVSLDGIEKTHEYIRQRPGSFARATGAMKMMRDAGIRFCAVSQISNINLGELDDLRQILIDCGCKLWRIQMTTYTGRMQRDLVLSLENYPKLIDKILEMQKSNTIRVDVGENIGYYGCKGTEMLDGLPYLGCYAGTRVAGIESNGNVKGCLSMPEEFVEGNIRDSSFTEIWNNPNGFAYNRKFTRDTASGACHDCRYLILCRGGCTTTSVSATGCRANNPYCMYQIEKAQGITPIDNEVITNLLEKYRDPAVSG